MFYKFGWSMCMIFIYLLFRVRIIGRENIPPEKGYILAANHRTNYDPLLVAAAMHKQVHYMAKAELFRGPLMHWIFTHLGAFPVERGKGDTGAIVWATQLIREGRVLGMFPEGTRSKDGNLQRPRSGAALIAMQTGADVLPCAVCYGQKLGFRSEIKVVYGKLIENAEFGFTPGETSPHELKAASQRIMREIQTLLEANQ